MLYDGSIMLSELLQPTAYSLATQIYSTYTNIGIVTSPKIIKCKIFYNNLHVSQPTKISLEKVADNESCDKAKEED